jgi:HECT-domain (ubiquitin-transferase)
VEDLGLTMTVAESNLGMTEEVELMSGGGSIPVTSDNRLYYISSYSNYILNVRTS